MNVATGLKVYDVEATINDMASLLNFTKIYQIGSVVIRGDTEI
jgi:hypothetical protein